VIGPNGIGKSTLLKILMDEVSADCGTVEWGYETHPGYFAQDNTALFAGDEDVQAWLWDRFPSETLGLIRGKLGALLFSQDDVDKRVAALSGGEQARLVFCMLGIKRPNVLILDEPTNHLDLEGIDALTKSLRTFEGTLIFVSHNRWFVEQLATRVVELSTEGVFDCHGTYAEYVALKHADHLDSSEVLAAQAESRRKSKREKKRRKSSKR
jgi:ATPase subunit of ABC transporter with duplicated ATPase domains